MGATMSERTYALRKLRAFVVKRAKELRDWKPDRDRSDDALDDCLFAIKIRMDEDRIVMREIDRMLKFGQSGRKKKAA